MITIGIPCGGSIKADTVISLLTTLQAPPTEKALYIATGNYVHENRTTIVKRALLNKATHVMFIDADMTFPPNGIDRLMKDDKDIVGANYNVRGNPSLGNTPASTVKFVDENKRFIAKPGSEIPRELFKCYAVGTGFMLIKMSVFEKLSEPWFFFRDYIKDDGGREMMTEDVYFCEKANEAGFEVWCDPQIPMGHQGEYIY